MKRTYISPEHIYLRTNGTKSMTEQKNFYGSKMMDIEDTIIIDNRSISYYQNPLGEQISIVNEIILPPVIYSFDDDKKSNHLFEINKSQTILDKERNTIWDLNINLKPILKNYIFANIKYNRTFESILNSMTYYNNINMAINDYIDNNIIKRYKFKTIDFYVYYTTLQNINTYRYQINFDSGVYNDNNKTNKLLTNVDLDYNKLTGTYRQEKSSTEYNFNYYFTITFEKI